MTMKSILINDTTWIFDFGPPGSITEDENTVYSCNYGPMSKGILVPEYSVIEADMPDYIDMFNRNQYAWDPVNQTFVRRIFPADPQVCAQGIAISNTDLDQFIADLFGPRHHILTAENQAALDYVASGYVDAVPDFVQVYADNHPGGAITPAQAASEITDRFNTMVDGEKAVYFQRQVSQAAMQAATTADDLQAAIDYWDTYIRQKRAEFGLPELPPPGYMSLMATGELS